MSAEGNAFFIQRPWPPLWEVTLIKGGRKDKYIYPVIQKSKMMYRDKVYPLFINQNNEWIITPKAADQGGGSVDLAPGTAPGQAVKRGLSQLPDARHIASTGAAFFPKMLTKQIVSTAKHYQIFDEKGESLEGIFHDNVRAGEDIKGTVKEITEIKISKERIVGLNGIKVVESDKIPKDWEKRFVSELNENIKSYPYTISFPEYLDKDEYIGTVYISPPYDQ